MGNTLLTVTIQVFKGERNKTYLGLPINKEWKDGNYIAEANKLHKVKISELTIRNGYVLNGKDLYWSVKDMPDDLKGSTVTPIKVVYKK